MAVGTLHPLGSGKPRTCQCTSNPAGTWAALTVFSLSARVSRFSGDNCSCCWSAMVASGVRTESMANKGSGGDDEEQAKTAGIRCTADCQRQRPLKSRGTARSEGAWPRLPLDAADPARRPAREI